MKIRASQVRLPPPELKTEEMEIYKGITAVTYRELTDDSRGEPVMSKEAYKSLIRKDRRRLEVIRPGKGLDNEALISWASIPARYKEKFIDRYGDPEKIMSEKQKVLKYDEAAFEYFSEGIKSEGPVIKSEKAKEYAINASVLNRLLERLDTQKVSRNKCGNSTPIAWEGIAAESERLRNEYGHTLPKSTARLRDKMREYRREGYRCLVSGKLYNFNSVKITEDAGRYLIALKRSFNPRYTDRQIFEKYNEDAPEMGWKVLKAPSSVVQYLNRPEVRVQWDDAVYGELHAKQRYQRQNVTILPTRRDSLWYGDGTKLNLYYKVYTPQGVKMATLWVFEVVDAYSECLLGYDIATSETFESMFAAYRMAIETTGHLPVELAYDGQGGTRRGDAQEWLSKIARYSHWVAPHNPQSKTIESIFGRFQSQVLHKHFNYTGGNITDKSEKSRPNIEFIEANVEALPTYDELCAMYAEARQEWNLMRHFKYGKPRIELYEASMNEESICLTDAVRRDLFWMTTQKDSTFTARGIQITVNKRKYIYDVYSPDGMPDMKFRRDNTGRAFYVQYDPQDMDHVRLCTKDGYGYRFIAEARPYVEIHRAMQDQTTEERSFAIRMVNLNKLERVRRYLDNLNLSMEFGMAPEQQGFVAPKLQGMTDREFEYYADIVRKEHMLEGQAESSPVMPGTVGQVEKMMSDITFDQAAAYDKM